MRQKIRYMKKKILIVEDEVIISKDLKYTLIECGFDVTNIVTNGIDAMKAIIDDIPDLVLMDIKIHGNMDGVETAKEIYARFNLPIVYLTSYSDYDTLRRVMNFVSYGYMVKPFEKSELNATLHIAFHKFESAVADISLRRKMEESLKLRESTLTAVFDSTEDGILVVDNNGRVIHRNNKFNKMWHIPSKLINPIHDTELLDIVLSQLSKPNQFIVKVKELYNSSKSDHFVIYFKDGRIFERRSNPLLENEIVKGRVWSFNDITERKLAEESLKTAHEELRNLAIYVDTKVENEKKKISRELHDGLGQLLTAIKINSSLLRRNFEGDKAIIDKFDELNAMLDDGVKIVQDVTKALRSNVLDDLGITAAINSRLLDFEETSGIKTKFICNPDVFPLDPDLSISIYKIFLEIFTNIIRHAKIKQAKIQLRKSETSLSLIIRDYGIGITKEQISSSLSFGLIGIRERVNTWQGTMKVVGIPGKGTTIKIRIPLS